jgi:hypothetical protein
MAKITQTATVVGVFHDRPQAQKAIDELLCAGFREEHIGVATRSEGHEPALDRNTGSMAAEGAAIGAATGAGIGALWGIGVAAQLFPPLGIVAGGTLMALLASAATGAGVATVIGALVGLGVPEDEAAYYEGELKGGRTLVTVQSDGRQDEAWAILSRCGAYNRSTAATTPHVPLEVPVQREEVVIERGPAPGRQTADADFRSGEAIRVPVKEGQVHGEREGNVNVRGANDPNRGKEK